MVLVDHSILFQVGCGFVEVGAGGIGRCCNHHHVMVVPIEDVTRSEFCSIDFDSHFMDIPSGPTRDSPRAAHKCRTVDAACAGKYVMLYNVSSLLSRSHCFVETGH